MQRAGSASWQFTEGIEEMPLVALFVRDSVGLPIMERPDAPPRLDDGSLHDHRDLVGFGQHDAAGAAWTDWWLRIVSVIVRQWQHKPASMDQQVLLQRLAEHQAVFDPPAFDSLVSSPALREPARATFEDAIRWAGTRRSALQTPPDGRPGQFDYDTVRAVAEQVARQHQINPGAVHGCALVLPVRTTWWTRFAPGAVLCSIDAAREPGIARTVLADAFESGLSR